jgi:hypothetical protein
VTAFLVEEMFPLAAAAMLRDTYGHDAVHVAEVGSRRPKTRRSQRLLARKAELSSPRTSRTSPPNVTSCSCSFSRGTSPQGAGRQRRSPRCSTAGQPRSLHWPSLATGRLSSRRLRLCVRRTDGPLMQTAWRIGRFPTCPVVPDVEGIASGPDEGSGQAARSGSRRVSVGFGAVGATRQLCGHGVLPRTAPWVR